MRKKRMTMRRLKRMTLKRPHSISVFVSLILETEASKNSDLVLTMSLQLLLEFPIPSSQLSIIIIMIVLWSWLWNWSVKLSDLNTPCCFNSYSKTPYSNFLMSDFFGPPDRRKKSQERMAELAFVGSFGITWKRLWTASRIPTLLCQRKTSFNKQGLSRRLNAQLYSAFHVNLIVRIILRLDFSTNCIWRDISFDCSQHRLPCSLIWKYSKSNFRFWLWLNGVESSIEVGNPSWADQCFEKHDAKGAQPTSVWQGWQP